MTTRSQAFHPEWASAPGETIADVLADRQLSIADFARLIDFKPDEAKDLIEGRTSISLAVARRLARTIGASVEFWMSRDYQYRADIARIHGSERVGFVDCQLGT